jgi:NAD(P)-dependent dehydrogenase (short-subunit alcohol dehydrogenase family)
MKTIVITGSTGGIGLGMADAFLARGCCVVISGRTQERVDKAVSSLAGKHDLEWVLGQACDVTDYAQVQTLWNAAVDRFGKVDVWVNNAGLPGAYQEFWTVDPAHMHAVVETNLIGTMYGSKVAIEGMLAQGFGAVYNMEGAGSTGRIHTNLIHYGSSKRGVNYLVKGLAEELKGKPVIIGSLSPGMVVTEFYDMQRRSSPESWERTKRVLNIIADKVETVAPWLADRMLENKKNGADISFATRGKVMWRFLTAPFSKRDLFGEE